MIRRCVLQPDTAFAPRGCESPIDVFWFPLDGNRVDGPAAVREELSLVVTADERSQWSRLRLPTLRDRRLAARGMLRCLLSALLHVEPQRIILERGEAGKPSIAWPSARLHFNVSHSDELAAIAVSPTSAVGIDVERISELLSPQTLERLCQHDSLLRGGLLQGRSPSTRELLDAWVREEARRKATGVGWSGVPIGGEADPNRAADLALVSETIVEPLSAPGEDCVAALAIADRSATRLPRVRQWTLSAREIAGGTLTLHAERRVDEASLTFRSADAVCPATYC
jgi:phosphopantetheinyl transferase